MPRKSNKKTFYCPQCGELFTRRPFEIKKGKILYCSRKCKVLGMKVPIGERFEKFIKKTEHCWEWTGNLGINGYAPIRVDGVNSYAHRMMWITTFGEIPEGLCVLHHCDNRKCVNPDHLFIGTPKDNTEDMMKKGRGCCGEKHPASKLTNEMVVSIRKMSEGGLSQKKIGKTFGISQPVVGEILRRVMWKHI